MSGNKRQELGAEPDGALEARAAALVNPASGLANDFLNVYNEILMLIEMLPAMPELADDIFGWRPCSYRSYFMQCNLPGRAEALDEPRLEEELILPHEDGRRRAWLHRQGVVLGEEAGEDGVRLRLRWTERQKAQFEGL